MLIYNINEGDGGMHQRHKKILDMLQAGKLLIKEAAVELGVTEMTLRRDLKELESKKMVLLVKGGAVPHPARYEPEQTETELLGRKFAIAKALFLRILPTDTIFIRSWFNESCICKGDCASECSADDCRDEFSVCGIDFVPFLLQSDFAGRGVADKLFGSGRPDFGKKHRGVSCRLVDFRL